MSDAPLFLDFADDLDPAAVFANAAYLLRDYQNDCLAAISAAWAEGLSRILAAMATGCGKCLGRGTPILMFDGSIRNVEDVRNGEQLMGPDSKPRNVLSVCRGSERLFRVVPTKGQAYVVNESHILSLKITGKRRVSLGCEKFGGGSIANVSVCDYLASSKNFKHCAKGWRVGVEFNAREIHPDLPPYILWVWLGDGGSRGDGFATCDWEIAFALTQYAKSLGHHIRCDQTGDKCPMVHVTTRVKPGRGIRNNRFKRALHELGLLGNKHVPFSYKSNTRAVRLEVLAGLLDTDGHLGSGSCYDFINANETIADDVCFLARSVGLAAYKTPCRKTCGNNGVSGDYFRVCVSGETSIVPCRIKRQIAHSRRQKKDALVTGFTVEPVGVGDYYGFEIDGDRLFLLGDFTVTHNTIIFSQVAREMVAAGGRVLILAHTEELLDQAADKLERSTGLVSEREKAAESASLQASVVIASVQTLTKHTRLCGFPDDHFALVVVDEAHRSLAPSYLKILNYFHFGRQSLAADWKAPAVGEPYAHKAKILGVTATPDRGDKRSLGRFYQRIVFDYGLLPACRAGYLVRPISVQIPLRIDLRNVKISRSPHGADFDAKELSVRISPFLGEIARHVFARAGDRKIVLFLPGVETARLMSEALNAAGMVAQFVSGACTDRTEKMAWFARAGRGHAICNAMLLTEGWDCPDVSCVCVLRPTKLAGLYRQCVDEQTEILTRDGWKRDVAVGESVAGFDIQTGSLNYVPAQEVFRRPLAPEERFVAIKAQSCDIRVTENHRMLYDHAGRTGWKFKEAGNLASLRDTSILPCAGVWDGAVGVPLTDDELSFIGWAMTNAHINEKTGGIVITQGEHRPWLEQIETCIRGCGFKFTQTKRERRTSQFKSNSLDVNWTISRGEPRGRDKHLRGWGALAPWLSKSFAEPLMSLSPVQFDVLIEAMHLAHGAKQEGQTWTRRSYHIHCGRHRQQADRLQIVALRCGWRATVSIHQWNGHEQFIVRLKRQNFVRVGGHVGDRPSWKFEPGTGEQCWCVKNELGTLVTRRNGKVAIVGNCVGRGTRTLPGVLDGLNTRAERLSAIAASQKPDLMILDFLWLSDRLDLIESVDLVADRPEIRAAMKKAVDLKMQGGDLISLFEVAEHDLLKSLEIAARKHAKKNARVIDPLAWAVSLGDDQLLGYEPISQWDELPMTAPQAALLHRNGIDAAPVTCRGMASKLIDRVVQRHRLGLCTVKQLELLTRLGVADAALLSRAEATTMIGSNLADKRDQRAYERLH